MPTTLAADFAHHLYEYLRFVGQFTDCQASDLWCETCRAIKHGTKTVEGRLNSRMMQGIKAQDTIDFYSQHGSVRVLVTEVTRHQSFHDMLSRVGVQAVLPEFSRVTDGVRLFQSFPGYAEKEKKFGVLAFHIQMIE